MATDANCLALTGKGIPELLDDGLTWTRCLEIAAIQSERDKAQVKLQAMAMGVDIEKPRKYRKYRKS